MLAVGCPPNCESTSLKRLFNRLFPAFRRLPRQSVDQIQRYIFDTGTAGVFYRMANVIYMVNSAQLFQFILMERLRTQADAVYTVLVYLTKQFQRSAFRIRFQGNFRFRSYRVIFLQTFQQ